VTFISEANLGKITLLLPLLDQVISWPRYSPFLEIESLFSLNYTWLIDAHITTKIIFTKLNAKDTILIRNPRYLLQKKKPQN